jgi:Protein of unknown function (DUF1236)
MTNRFLISVAAAALIAGTGFANAQGTGMGRDAGSAGSPAQQSAPSSDRGGASSGTMQRDSGSKSDMKSTQSEQKPMGAEKNQRAEDHMKGGKDMKAEGKEDRGGMKSEQKAEQKSEKGQTTGQGKMERDQSTTQHRDQTTTQGRDQTMQKGDQKAGDQKAQGQQDRTQTQTQTQGGAAGQSTTTGQAGAGAKLSTEQRTQITSVIKEQRVAPVTNVNFSLSVGTRVPRDVTFHTLPERVVTIYPEWRRYKFILVKEQIVIVDPDTYEIVAILES